MIASHAGTVSAASEQIASTSDAAGREVGEEGCLSFPGIQAEVERWVDITVTYQDRDGKEQTLQADGWLARIVQHEMDHLEGILFIDHLSRLKRDMVLKKLAKSRKAA